MPPVTFVLPLRLGPIAHRDLPGAGVGPVGGVDLQARQMLPEGLIRLADGRELIRRRAVSASVRRASDVSAPRKS